jgi:hypothetical protein
MESVLILVEVVVTMVEVVVTMVEVVVTMVEVVETMAVEEKHMIVVICQMGIGILKVTHVNQEVQVQNVTLDMFGIPIWSHVSLQIVMLVEIVGG